MTEPSDLKADAPQVLGCPFCGGMPYLNNGFVRPWCGCLGLAKNARWPVYIWNIRAPRALPASAAVELREAIYKNTLESMLKILSRHGIEVER